VTRVHWGSRSPWPPTGCGQMHKPFRWGCFTVRSCSADVSPALIPRHVRRGHQRCHCNEEGLQLGNDEG
jgi:hypothetical protein